MSIPACCPPSRARTLSATRWRRASVTGVTVHVVDEALDGGPIVAQRPVTSVPGDDSEEALLERMHAAEHQLLPRVVALALAGAVTVT